MSTREERIIEDLDKLNREELGLLYKLIRALITKQPTIIEGVCNRIQHYSSNLPDYTFEDEPNEPTN